MNRIYTLSLTLVLISVPAAGPLQVETITGAEADGAAIAKGNSHFALELYAKLMGQEGNLFFSPYSISTALAMTHAGARGETADQMAKVMHFDLSMDRLHPAYGKLISEINAGGKKGNYELHIANALWGQKGYAFLKSFLDLTQTNYGAGLKEVDFKGATENARKTINTWVEEKTNDKIKELIKPGVLNTLTRLVLTNAIYFKGNWAEQFKKERTEDAPFLLGAKDKATVKMMTHKAKYMYSETGELQVLELPYAGNELSMVVILPKQVDGLAALEKTLTLPNLESWLKKTSKREVIVYLPKFKMTCQFELAATLQSMGMADAFTSQADFSGMNGRKDLFISAVIHKAFVDVNEEGTEAAAATAVVMEMAAALPQPTPVFRADHPFVFMIRHLPSNSILFIGRVINPKAT